MFPVNNVWKSIHQQRFLPPMTVGMFLVCQMPGEALNYVTVPQDKLLSVELNHSYDLLSGVIPTQHVKVEIDNADDQFSPDNPSGDWHYLPYAIALDLYFNFPSATGGAYIYIPSAWYLSPDGDRAYIEADAMFIHGEAQYDKTFAFDYNGTHYNGVYNGKLDVIVASALAQLNEITHLGYTMDVDPVLATLSGTVNDIPNPTLNNVIQYIANMSRCTITISQSPLGLVIKPWDQTPAGITVSNSFQYSYPEISYTREIRQVACIYKNGEMYSTVIGSGSNGETQTITNPMITQSADALAVAVWGSKTMANRRTIAIEWRPDLSIQIGDNISIEGTGGTIHEVVITGLNYRYDGGWTGTMSGMIIDPNTLNGYTDEIYAMNSGDIIFTREE